MSSAQVRCLHTLLEEHICPSASVRFAGSIMRWCDSLETIPLGHCRTTCIHSSVVYRDDMERELVTRRMDAKVVRAEVSRSGWAVPDMTMCAMRGPNDNKTPGQHTVSPPRRRSPISVAKHRSRHREPASLASVYLVLPGYDLTHPLSR